MNDDPSDVDVLYAKVDCEPLQEIADQMVGVFIKHGMCAVCLRFLQRFILYQTS